MHAEIEPPPAAKFVNAGAAAFNVELIFSVDPEIVIVTVKDWAPVPNGNGIPPGFELTVIAHFVPAGTIAVLLPKFRTKEPVESSDAGPI
jgi:hypothetical protein